MLGPLDHPRLREIERTLDAGDVNEAQRLLTALGDPAQLRHGTTYLAIRLLYQRGRIQRDGVIQRLEDLLRDVEHFTEASSMLSGLLAGSRVPAFGEPDPALASAVTVRPPESAAQLVTARPLESAGTRKSRSTDPAPPSVPRVEPVQPVSAHPVNLPTPLPAPGEKQRERAPRPLSGPQIPAAPNMPSFSELGNEPEAKFEDAADNAQHAPLELDLSERPPPEVSEPAITELKEPPPEISEPAITEVKEPLAMAEPGVLPERIESTAVVDSHPPQSLGAYRHVYSDEPHVEHASLPASFRRSRRPGPAPERSGAARLPARSEAPRRAIVEENAHLEPPISAEPRRRVTPVAFALTPFSIAALLGEGKYAEALEAFGRHGDGNDPQLALLRVRALVGAGHKEDALAALKRIVETTLIEPELRATAARLLIELGDPQTALKHARRAHKEDPSSILAKLALAWACLRVARRIKDQVLFDTAGDLLGELKTRSGPMPALTLALKALHNAFAGDAERAIEQGQRALSMEADLPDALIAVAMGSARRSFVHDAQTAWSRLRELDEVEARALASELATHGVQIDRPSMLPVADGDRVFWPAEELNLVKGQRESSAVWFENACHERLQRLAEQGTDQGFPVIGPLSAGFLTEAPIFRHFAPFDLSLHSLARVNGALDVLYGKGPRKELPSDEFSMLILVGTYLGEAFRYAHSGNWEGSVADLESASIACDLGKWFPFRQLITRLRDGTRIQLGGFTPAPLPHPGADLWSRRLPCPADPPAPWDPEPWPSIAELPSLGRALANSVVGLYCKELAFGPLDHTVGSLKSLDKYLNLIAPGNTSLDQEAGWARRIAGLAGAYVGEVLRETLGGEWMRETRPANGAHCYRLALRGRPLALPVAQVYDRVVGFNLTPVSEYAKKLLQDH